MTIKLVALILHICFVQIGFTMEKTPGNSQAFTSQELVTLNNNLDETPANEFNIQDVFINSINLDCSIRKANEIINSFPKFYEYENLENRVFKQNYILKPEEINAYKNQLNQMVSVYTDINERQKSLFLAAMSEKYNSAELREYIKNRINYKYQDSLEIDNLTKIVNTILELDYMSMMGEYISDYLKQKNITKIEDIVLFMTLSKNINAHLRLYIIGEWHKTITQLNKENKDENNGISILFSEKLFSAMDLYNDFYSFLNYFFGDSLEKIRKAELEKDLLKSNIIPLSRVLNSKK